MRSHLSEEGLEAVTPALSPAEVGALRYFGSNPTLRRSPRDLDDAAAEMGISLLEMQGAMDSLSAAGLLVEQDLLDEEPDPLIGRRGQVLRLTLAGQHVLESEA